MDVAHKAAKATMAAARVQPATHNIKPCGTKAKAATIAVSKYLDLL